MGYIQGYGYDIFISYAHLDNVRYRLAHSGWIDSFEQDLRQELGEYLGQEVSIFRDPQLPLFGLFPKHLKRTLGSSAIFICVLSPRYLKSSWCMRELNEFCVMASADRVIKVVKTPLREQK